MGDYSEGYDPSYQLRGDPSYSMLPEEQGSDWTADDAEIDPTVVVQFPGSVHHRAKIGPGSIIRPSALVCPDVQIGAGVLMGYNCVVQRQSSIGDRTRLEGP